LTLAFLVLAQEPPKKEAEATPKPAERKPVYTALVGGDVYTVTQGVHRGGTVLLRDSKIHRVGASIDLPEGTTKVDVSGKRVLPGFVAVSARGLGLGFGGGAGKIADAVDPYQEAIKVALASGITSAHVDAGGSGFFGPSASPAASNAVLKMSYGTLDGMVILEPASVSLAGWVTGGAAERFDIRENFRKAREFLETERDYERRRADGKLKPNEAAPKAAPPLDRFVRQLKGEIVTRIPAANTEQIRKALELVGEFRFKAVLTGVVEAWAIPDEVGRARAYCIVTPRTKAHAERSANRPTGSSIEQAALLRKAGVKFAILPTTPMVGTGGIAGRDLTALPMEAAFAIKGGLDEQTALESITITAAEICGVDARLGSIEEGKDADLIVLDGDPFDYRTLVDLTFVNGKLLYDRSKSPYFQHLKSSK
jgi:imidazolonepropionase-like amidohydrolase